MIRPAKYLALAAVALASTACWNKRVERIEPTAVTDLSGRWNDTDSRLVANELISQSLGADWVRDWSAQTNGSQPTLIVGEFRNRTMEHIAVGTFVRDLERAFITSGTVRVVASSEEREEVRAERADQQVNAAPETRMRIAREQGARFMLQGDVQAIQDSERRERIIYYQIDATLIDLESNAKVWVGQHKIKKYVQRRRLTP